MCCIWTIDSKNNIKIFIYVKIKCAFNVLLCKLCSKYNL